MDKPDETELLVLRNLEAGRILLPPKGGWS